MRNAILLSGLGALAVAVVAGFLIGRTISDPLRSLAGTARAMAGVTSRRAPRRAAGTRSGSLPGSSTAWRKASSPPSATFAPSATP